MTREMMKFMPISTETAEHYVWGGNCDGWFLLKEDTISVIQERMPPGSTEVMHLHHRSRQLFYVLSGELTMETASARTTIPAGHALAIEPNVAHCAVNESSEAVEFLVISSPPSHGDKVPL